MTSWKHALFCSSSLLAMGVVYRDDKEHMASLIAQAEAQPHYDYIMADGSVYKGS